MVTNADMPVDAVLAQSRPAWKFADVVITEGMNLKDDPGLQTGWANGLVHIVKPGGVIQLHMVNKELANAVIDKAKMVFGNGVGVKTENVVIRPFPPAGFEDSKETLYIISIPN